MPIRPGEMCIISYFVSTNLLPLAEEMIGGEEGTI